VLMVWFFLIPSIPNVLGNFVLPMMLGSARCRLSQDQPDELVYLSSRRSAGAMVADSWRVDTGWTFYTPYSTTYANSHVISMAAGVFVAGFSSI
jgi:cytochrome c oxidase subunit 1